MLYFLNYEVAWSDDGVPSVVIHLRCPKIKNAYYGSDDWMWITDREQLSLTQAKSLVI